MRFEVYCDESRQDLFARPDQGEFVVLGSLWLPAEHRERHKDAIRALRVQHDLHGEFKWQKVSPSRLAFYNDLMGLFFDDPDLRFRCLVLPAGDLDAARFHQSDNELMFHKFYYLMLHGWILDFNSYRIFIDMKTNRVRNRLRMLHEVLSSANLSSVVHCVQALPSSEVDLLQLVDVLIGAVGYSFHNLEGSAAKLAVVKAIEDGIGHPIAPTVHCEPKFNVFRFRPGGGW